jgi:hypothetical protein
MCSSIVRPLGLAASVQQCPAHTGHTTRSAVHTCAFAPRLATSASRLTSKSFHGQAFRLVNHTQAERRASVAERRSTSTAAAWSSIFEDVSEGRLVVRSAWCLTGIRGCPVPSLRLVTQRLFNAVKHHAKGNITPCLIQDALSVLHCDSDYTLRLHVQGFGHLVPIPSVEMEPEGRAPPLYDSNDFFSNVIIIPRCWLHRRSRGRSK